MATTRIIPMHLNKGKTLAQCLADRTEYGMNPDKTDGGELISSFACEPETVVSEFALSKREYRELTGRVQESDIIAYQIRQSFKPGGCHFGMKTRKRASAWIPSVKDIPSRSSVRFLQEAKRTIRSSRRNTRNEKSAPR